MLLGVPYAAGSFALLGRRGGGPTGELAEAMVDGQFYLVGVAALVLNSAAGKA